MRMFRAEWLLVAVGTLAFGSTIFVAACQKGVSGPGAPDAPGSDEVPSGDFTPYFPVRRGESVERLSKVQCPQWWRRNEVWTCASFRHPVVGESWGSEGILEVKALAGRITEVEWRRRIPIVAEELSGLAAEAARIAKDLTARLGQPVYSNVERGEDSWVAAVARGEFHMRWWIGDSKLVYRIALLDADGRPRERELALSLTRLGR